MALNNRENEIIIKQKGGSTIRTPIPDILMSARSM